MWSPFRHRCIHECSINANLGLDSALKALIISKQLLLKDLIGHILHGNSPIACAVVLGHDEIGDHAASFSNVYLVRPMVVVSLLL